MESFPQIEKQMPSTEFRVQFEDRAMGCIMGAFVGDACGAYLEFVNDISDVQMEECMKMPGGGSWAVGPGQITDDSEMAFCLMNALIQSNIDGKSSDSERKLNTEQIGVFYREWIKSDPDLMGRSTGKALR